MATSRYLAEQLLKGIKKHLPEISVSGNQMTVKQNGQIITFEQTSQANPYIEQSRRLR